METETKKQAEQPKEPTVEELKAQIATLAKEKEGMAADRSQARKLARDLKRQLADQEIKGFGSEQQPDSPGKDPLDVYIESDDYDPDQPIPGSVTVAHERFKDKIATHRKIQTEVQSMDAMRERSFLEARRSITEDTNGEGYDFDTVVQKGLTLLDPVERDLVSRGRGKAGKLLYNFCLEHLRELDQDYQQKPSDKTDKTTEEKKPEEVKPDNKEPTVEEVLGRKPRMYSAIGLEYPKSP